MIQFKAFKTHQIESQTNIQKKKKKNCLNINLSSFILNINEISKIKKCVSNSVMLIEISNMSLITARPHPK